MQQLESEKAVIQKLELEIADLRATSAAAAAESELLREGAKSARSEIEHLSATVQRLEVEECGLRQQLITAAEELAKAQEQARTFKEDAST